jgi:hypothetical protein
MMWILEIPARPRFSLQDNSLPVLAQRLLELLWGEGTIADRYDSFRAQVRGFGSAMITELLAFTHPDQCGLWNKKAREALILLGFLETNKVLKKSQISGQEYQQFNDLLQIIRSELQKYDLPELDLLGIDYFLFELWNTKHKAGAPIFIPEDELALPSFTDFDHGELIDQLIGIGQWLGFEVHKEKLIAKGAKVDALWQARIANLGVVTYVFEVQRRGSPDSLILNLQRALNNPSVQRLVVIAPDTEIMKIRQEIETLPESFRRMVGYMDFKEAIRAAELVAELSSIINKLELVKSEFGS